jgi:hypothetical protein
MWTSHAIKWWETGVIVGREAKTDCIYCANAMSSNKYKLERLAGKVMMLGE